MKPIFKLLILSISLFCVSSACNSDKNTKPDLNQQAPTVKESWQKWIRKNSVPIASLTDTNTKDLHFLQESIGNRSLVQLGESSHGVKEFNQIKVRTIKYLHEEMAFNVIAFESGLFECYNANNNPSHRSPELLIGSIFSVWRTEEVLELFKYIIETQDTDEPLILAGFDFQMSGDWSERSEMLEKVASSLDPVFARELFKTDSIFAVNKKPNDIKAMRTYVMENQAGLIRIYSHLEELLDTNMRELAINYQSTPLIPLFAHQIARSMLSYIDFWLDEENEMSIRDRAMADNVNFLKNIIYPDEKIIIWAHNLHIRHNNEHLDLSAYEKIKSMGSWLHEKYPEEIYTIGLYMYKGQGAYNNQEVYNIKSHAPNSLETILHSAGPEICFIDLSRSKITPKNNWIISEILTLTWGLEDLKLTPINQYDAILFVDSVSPPVYLN